MQSNNDQPESPTPKQLATPATNVGDSNPPSTTHSPSTPVNRQAHPMNPRAGQQNMANARGGVFPRAAGAGVRPPASVPRYYGNPAMGQQRRQPLDMFNDGCSGNLDNLRYPLIGIPNSAAARGATPLAAAPQRVDQTQHNFQIPQAQVNQTHGSEAHQIHYYSAQNMPVSHNYPAHQPNGNPQNYYSQQEQQLQRQQYEMIRNMDPEAARYMRPPPGTNLSYPPAPNGPSGSHANTPNSGHAGVKPEGNNGPPAQASAGPAAATLAGDPQAADPSGPAHPAAHCQVPPVPQAYQDFSNHVYALLNQPTSDGFCGHIKGPGDVESYRSAVWWAKRPKRARAAENKCHDFPADDAGKQEVVRRLFEAIVNLDGEQCKVSEKLPLRESTAVTFINNRSPLEIEIVAWDLMEAMRKVQMGLPVGQQPYPLVQEATFGEKVDAVVEALSFNKLLCKSVMESVELQARVAANPASELVKKNGNMRTNKRKGDLLSEANQKNGTARKATAKGRGKRAADDDDDVKAETASEPGSSSAGAVAGHEAVQASQAGA
ncbi:hypothetical protein KVR01_006317 [Diaporthe batatas]|uniref:uncharacterized protein n=1 Tax=Diaporthe batatas TaxID=748121 RepID=UPI001D05B66F|nr:uncharacterized protein KVR01_006317 [Diaporthe batatas]KAG8164399.1 hypothetical protein KVR01_006317 [Diaporthe batatas]